ncbi:MAG: DUF3368 domain-containing protein [Anaerolineae bacterium]|nr:DUF3368 domain-containing protein [Anaerolineae bacterium]
MARQKELVGALKPYLDSLLALDFRISKTVYQLALRQVGEELN